MTLNKFIQSAIVASAVSATCGCGSCSSDGHISDDDRQRIDDYAGEYARRIVGSADNPMALDGALLDVRAREYKLSTEFGDEAAARFRTSVTDSLKMMRPDVYDLITGGDSDRTADADNCL